MRYQMTRMKTLLLIASMAVGIFLQTKHAHARDMQVLTVAGGCFWCVEADFEKVRGVTEVVSGYTGGTTANPTYDDLKAGGTGHYEAVQISYDRDQISERQLYDLFFRSIDPTDAGGQFCDRGESYRTAIFVSTQAELDAANAAKAAAEAELGQRIVTPILQAAPFYVAEDFHQNYYKRTDRVITRRGIMQMQDAY